MNHEFKKSANRVCRKTTKLWQSHCLKKGLKPFCKVPFSHSVHTEVNRKQIFSERFLRVSDRLNLSLARISIISYYVVKSYLFKDSLEFSAIIAAENNKTDTRIYGTIS